MSRATEVVLATVGISALLGAVIVANLLLFG